MSASAKDLLARLDALAERVEEARAAAETIAEGDPTALAELDAEVDAMAAGRRRAQGDQRRRRRPPA